MINYSPTRRGVSGLVWFGQRIKALCFSVMFRCRGAPTKCWYSRNQKRVLVVKGGTALLLEADWLPFNRRSIYGTQRL